MHGSVCLYLCRPLVTLIMAIRWKFGRVIDSLDKFGENVRLGQIARDGHKVDEQNCDAGWFYKAFVIFVPFVVIL